MYESITFYKAEKLFLDFVKDVLKSILVDGLLNLPPPDFLLLDDFLNISVGFPELLDEKQMSLRFLDRRFLRCIFSEDPFK